MTSAASLAVAAAHEVLTWAMLLAGPVNLVLGLLLHRFKSISAPYGRWAAGAGPGWGPLLNGRLAWMVSEGPGMCFIHCRCSHSSVKLKPRALIVDTACICG
jgi:hypothetical protein